MILWAPPILWMAAIFTVSSIPNVTHIPGGFSDTTAHAAAYALLAALLVRALARARWRRVTVRTLLAAIALSTGYGVTDEWHQRFVEGRTWAIADLAADFTGAAAAGIVVWAWSIIRHFLRSRGGPDGVYESSPRA